MAQPGVASGTGRRFLALAGLGLIGTVLLGVVLRWWLAGEVLVAGAFPHLRSAHSHLGYYGVLFPLVWWSWARSAVPVPGRWTTAAYAVAVAAATVGFAREGYAPLSIAASTAVLAVWLLSAWQVRRHALRPRDWLAAASPSILLSAAAIPVVALTLDRELVQGFLALLMFGVVVPAALHAARAPAPPTGLWPVAVVGAALALGPWPHPVSWLAIAVLGAIVTVAGWSAALPVDVRLLWIGVGAALLAMASQLLPETHGVAIGGLHYLVLGPLLLTLARPRVPAGVRLTWGALVVTFSLAIIGSWATLAAVLGTAVAAGVAFVTITRLGRLP